jgi:hypothetical protein
MLPCVQHEGTQGSGIVGPLVNNLGTRWVWMVSCVLGRIIPGDRAPTTLLISRLRPSAGLDIYFL